MRPPTQSESTAAPASKQPPGSKKRQNKTPSLENDDTTTQEVRATRKKRIMNEVSKDSSSDDDLPVGPNKAKGPGKARGRPGKRQRRSASPMPPPATKKRVPTNNHPGLIDKKTRRSKADVAAEKAIKESKAAIAAAVDEKILARLAEIEMEQESTEKKRLEEIIRKRPAAATMTDTTDAAQGDVSGNPTGMDVDSDEDLSQLMMDVDNSGDSESDDDQSDGSDTEKEATKKVRL